MTRPQRYLLRMGIFLIVVIGILFVLRGGLVPAFTANLALNGIITGVLLVGIVFTFRQVALLEPEVAWLEQFRQPGRTTQSGTPPRLLTPLVTALGERGRRIILTPAAMRTFLDSTASRLDENRDTSRYMIGVLVFLGLLGTFWGLLATVRSVGGVIAGLSNTSGDVGRALADLKLALQSPLAGMSTAFSCSLFGLSGSLILGFLDLQMGQAQNRFFNELEEWLVSVTKLSGGAVEGGEQPIPAYIQALLEQTADSLDNLQRVITRGEEGRLAGNQSMLVLTERLSTMTDQMRTEQSVLLHIAETQTELKTVLGRFNELARAGFGLDDATRGAIRNLDATLLRLSGELAQARENTVGELRTEIRLLARTVAAAAEKTEG